MSHRSLAAAFEVGPTSMAKGRHDAFYSVQGSEGGSA